MFSTMGDCLELVVGRFEFWAIFKSQTQHSIFPLSPQKQVAFIKCQIAQTWRGLATIPLWFLPASCDAGKNHRIAFPSSFILHPSLFENFYNIKKEHAKVPSLTPIWDPNLGPQFETPIWDPNFGPQFWTQVGTPIWGVIWGVLWYPNMRPPFGTLIWGVIWDPDLGPQFGTLIGDPDLGPRLGTPIGDPDLRP
jgi:hypothetical protein